MSQKLEDVKLLVKNDKRIWAAAGFIVVALVFWLMTGADGKRSRPPVRMAAQGEASKAGTGSEEQYGDLILAFKNDLEEAKTERKETTEILTRTRQDFDQYKNRVNGVFETLVDKFEALAREVDTLAAAMRAQQDAIPLDNQPASDGPDELEPFGEEEKDTVAPPPPELPARVSVIAPGDTVPVRLMTGVNAPVDGTPYPVVFELSGPITGPNGSTLDVGEARLIAAAQGSEADGRALFRLTQLSIRHPSGRRSVVEIDGWIVGEDGIRGMGGRLIDKLGQLIITTALVSGASALGESLDSGSRNTYDQGGNPLALNQTQFEAATASALTDASNRLGQALLNRYESLVPVVEVLSGREVVAIFSKAAEIELINDQQLLLAAAPQPPGAKPAAAPAQP